MNRIGKYRYPVGLAAALLLLLVVLSGCGGAAQATSWPGLTVVGGIVFTADLQQVQALDAETGESLWAYPVDVKEARRGLFYVTPAVDDEHVIVASSAPPSQFLGQPQNVIWALDRDGREIWSYRGAKGQFVEGGAIGGGMFVIGNSDGNVYGLDLESGQLRWKFETGHRVWATPLIVSETVYIGSMDRHLYALNVSSGAEIWKFNAGGAFAGTPAMHNGTLFVGAFDNRFYAIEAKTGTEVWDEPFEGGNWFWGSPAIYGDTVYAADVDGNVYALEAGTKEKLWEPVMLANEDGKTAHVRAGVALSEDGSTLFVSAEDGTVHFIKTSDGHEDPPIRIEGDMYSDPVVSGTIVFQPVILGPNRILALRVENGREVWAHPPQVEE